MLRDEEDWSLLEDRTHRADLFDAVKFVPLRWPASSFVSFGGELRHQYERFTNEEWGDGPPDHSGYLLQRYMFHGDLRLGRVVRVFGQLKSGIETGRNGGPRPPDEDRLDVHQAFGEFRLTQAPSHPGFAIRVGRQEFNFGSGRLVSVREGPNVRQSFDAIRVIVERGSWRADAFVSRPVITAPGAFDDRRDRGRALWGVYSTHTRPSGPNVDLYYLAYDRDQARFDQGTADERRHSVGSRIWGRTGALDFNTEIVAQWGAFGSSGIRAWTMASDSGYHVQWRGRPRIGMKADITSGDQNRTDDALGTFNPLFPKGAYFGLIAPAGPLNHADLHPSIAFIPVRHWRVSASWLFLWRTQQADGLYGLPGNLIRTGEGTRSRFVGHSPGVEVEWRASHHVWVTGNAALFSAGAFLQESPPAHTIAYLAAWTTFKF